MKIDKYLLISWGKIFLAGIPVTGLILFLRWSGWLQPFELAAYDLFFQLRPLEPIDSRIVIVGLQEGEIQKYYPLEDRTLAQLIEKIKAEKPLAIGLDFYRDVTIGSGQKQLLKTFATTPNLIGSKKAIGEEIEPPPILKQREQVASSDVVPDSDGILRRGMINPVADGETNLYSLGANLAFLYLQEQGFSFQNTPNGRGFQIGQKKFYPFEADDGGYRNADAGGRQFLLNYRNPKQSFKKVSFSQVLTLKADLKAEGLKGQNFNLFSGKIVLIGTHAESLKDDFYTPFSRSLNVYPKPIYGVEVQANIASHILSAVLDNRPQINVLPKTDEVLLIGLCGSATAVIMWRLRSTENYIVLGLKILGVALIGGSLLLVGSYLVFEQGWWLPIVPCLLEIGGISLLISGLILQEKNQELKILNEQIKGTTEQLIQKEKQAALATLTAGIVHEINNPLNYVLMYADLNLEELRHLKDCLKTYLSTLPVKTLKKLEESLTDLETNTQEIVTQGEKAANITRSLLHQGREETIPTFIDINGVVDSTLQVVTYSKQVAKNDLSLGIEIDYDMDIGKKRLVEPDLIQILINLINNACDAAFEKKSRLEDKFEPTIFVSTTLLNPEEIEIVVADNGDGIAPEVQKNLFDPFRTTKPPGEGTGLGLYVTNNLAQKNGGSIHWERDNETTKFVLRLPVRVS